MGAVTKQCSHSTEWRAGEKILPNNCILCTRELLRAALDALEAVMSEDGLMGLPAYAPYSDAMDVLRAAGRDVE